MATMQIQPIQPASDGVTLKRSFATAVLLYASTSSLPVSAQAGGQLEEIIVVARKVAENMQDVPVSISAFSGDQLEAAGISDPEELNGIVPGLYDFNGTPQRAVNPFIRGVGWTGAGNFESGVAVYLDGVYLPAAPFLNLFDMQSVEVLRGPQGTLFGRNATGGAILYNTRKPDDTFEGSVTARGGNYGRLNLGGMLNVPITDSLMMRGTVKSVEYDGHVENIAGGDDGPTDDSKSASLQFRWTPSDVVTVDVMASYYSSDQSAIPQQCQPLDDAPEGFVGTLGRLSAGNSALQAILGRRVPSHMESCTAVSELDSDEFGSEFDSVNKFDETLLSATLAWQLTDNLEFKSITSYRDQDNEGFFSADGVPVAVAARGEDSKRETWTQEFQFVGDAIDGRLRYATGVYGLWHDREDWNYGSADPYMLAPPGAIEIYLPINSFDDEQNEIESYAWFTQNSYDVTDQLELTVGLRYTYENRTDSVKSYGADLSTVFPGGTILATDLQGNPGVTLLLGGEASREYILQDPRSYEPNFEDLRESADDEESFDDWSPMVSLAYSFSPDQLAGSDVQSLMIFASYSEGFRSGGFSPFDGELLEIDPEVVQSIELGSKLDVGDNLRLNVSAYYMDYEDQQLNSTRIDRNGLPAGVVVNAAASTVQGLEAEFTWYPLSLWLVQGSLAYADGEYDDFSEPDPRDPTGASELDRSNETMPRLPEWTAYLATSYTLETSFGTLVPRLDIRYLDATKFVVGDALIELYGGGQIFTEDEVFIDARLSWISKTGVATISLWGKNLTDVDDYQSGALPIAGALASFHEGYVAPLTYGVDLTYRWQ